MPVLGVAGVWVAVPLVGDGRGFALIRDTDGGAHDGDTVYDRAVGPMQFEVASHRMATEFGAPVALGLDG